MARTGKAGPATTSPGRDEGSGAGEERPLLRNSVPLRLTIPDARHRPGAEADFSHIELSAPGALGRPPADTEAHATREHVYGLIRVLTDDGRAEGPWDPGLAPDVLRSGLRSMSLTRAFDDRMYRMQRQGKTSFYMKSTGEEAVACAAALALDPDDMCFPTYRQQGLLITRGYPVVDMMCQIYSNAKDRLKGRQMPIFYSSKAHGFFSISGNLGTQLIQAVGWAMASAYSGDTRIAATWTGEGATAEADFHHALTFASVYQVPCIIFVVNNQWAISSFSGIAGGDRTTFAARALGYGIAGLRVDGNDFLAVHAATTWAAERARANAGPTLVELFTYRTEGHSTSDDPSKYRAADEASRWPLGDPVERLARHLRTIGEWDDERDAALAGECTLAVREAGREAEAHGTIGTGVPHAVGTMFDDVYKELPWHLQSQRDQAIAGW